MDKYDFVIIGSGLGGLTTASILSKEGFSVCVLEKHHQIGGCLQTFKRDGSIFDTGIHYIGSMNEGQILNKLFKYFNVLDKIKIKKLDENGFDRINLFNDDKNYDYGMGYDRFVEIMNNNFPNEKQAINKYTKRIKEIINSLNLYNLRENENVNIFSSNFMTESVNGFIESTTSDKCLRDVLAGTNSLYAGIKNVTPLYVHAAINHFFIDSAYRFVDGSSQLANLLSGEIEKNGGKIVTKKEVVKFLSNENDLYGVLTSDGEVFEGKYFISTIHPVNTLKMVDAPIIRKTYRNRINSIPNTTSTFSLYITLKENSFEYINHNLYKFESDDVWGAAQYDEKTWPKAYMLITPASSKSDRWADCAIILTYMNYDDTLKWENSTIEQRGDDYIEFKKLHAEKLLNVVEKYFPGFKSKVKNYYTSTPLTYRDYTGTRHGSLYGIVRDCNDPLSSYISPRTKIPNLYFAGQNINMHGILGVIICSIITCGEFVGVNNLLRKIKNA